MSSDDEITALTKTPDSEEEMKRIMTEVVQPRRTHPTELPGAFPDLESALEFVHYQLMTVDQARTEEPPTQPIELTAVTDSIMITTKRVPPQEGSIVPCESSAVSEFDMNHTAGAELQALAEAGPNQIAVPVCQSLPAFPTHQLGECSAEPAQSHDVSAFLVDNYPVTLEDLDEFHAAQDYLLEPTVMPDSETSHPASEFHDLPESSLVDHPNNEALTHAEPDATEEASCVPHQPIATSQFETNASEFSNPMAPFAVTEQNDVQVHTISGAIGPYHSAVPECQNQSASPTHQHDESYTQPALESLDIAMNFTDSNPVSQEDLQALQEALSCVCEPSSPSYFDIHVPASPNLTESPMAHSPISRSLTDKEEKCISGITQSSSSTHCNISKPTIQHLNSPVSQAI